MVQKKHYLLLALMAIIAFIPLSVGAQSAKSVLDKVSAKLSSCGGIEATFNATAFKGSRAAGTTSGTICVQKGKFKVSSAGLSTWFDGHTQWSLRKGSDEVYVSNPSEAELQSMNPYTFVNLYKKGYNLQMRSTTYGGAACHEIRMTARNKKAGIQEMRIVVDKKTLMPKSIRMKSGGNWTRIRVGKISTGKHWSDSFFKYNHKKDSGIEIIDLR